MTCKTCHELISEGLDLCVRARKLDAQDRTNASLSASMCPEEWQASGNFDRHVKRHNVVFPDQPMMTRSGTVPLWVQDQYEKDLAEWERKSRKHMAECAGAY